MIRIEKPKKNQSFLQNNVLKCTKPNVFNERYKDIPVPLIKMVFTNKKSAPETLNTWRNVPEFTHTKSCYLNLKPSSKRMIPANYYHTKFFKWGCRLIFEYFRKINKTTVSNRKAGMSIKTIYQKPITLLCLFCKVTVGFEHSFLEHRHSNGKRRNRFT